jgi:hypothetical protein
MLYLNPPFYFINGVSIFPDHEDPQQFYYLPAAPHLTQLLDAASGQRIPQLQLIEYRGEAGNGGFLNFDCNIGLEQDALDDIANELKSQAKLRQPPRLAPVPVVDGTVKLILLDKQTPDSAPAGAPAPAGGPAPAAGGVTAGGTPGPVFVARILQSQKPALYGDNQATFSVQLTQNGVTVLHQALQGEMSPIGIVYGLDYLALRPAYSIRLHMDWDRIQKHLDEHFGIDSIFTSVDIDTAIDKLIDERAIVFEVDTFVPEGEDTSSIISSRDKAEAEVRDMITNAFFEPSLNPEKETKDGWDKAEHLMKTAGAMAVTGGWAALGSFSYKKVNYTRIDKKLLNVTMNERTTVKRSIYPQGHLSGLFRPLLQQGVKLENFILKVDLDDPWFRRRKVKVISRASFDEDSIGSLNVTLRYGGEPKNVILEPGHDRDEVQWASSMTGTAMQWDVTSSYKVNFKAVEGAERPISLESPEKVVSVENLEVDPRELYSIVPVPIIALNFPWDRYPFVEIQTRYTDEAHGIRMEDTLLFDDKKHDTTWKMFVRDPQRTRFSYKLIYRGANRKDVEMPWVETDEERITIRDPYPQKRTLTVVPNVRWTEVSRAFVDVSYEDPENDVSVQQSFEFAENDAAPKTFTVDLANPDRRVVGFEATVMKKDNTLVQVPKSFTLERRIFIYTDMKGHKIIMIRPEAVDFAAKNVKQMTVEALYEDTGAGLSFADTFTFKSSGDRASFEFDYVDDQKGTYQYRVTSLYTNGLSKTTDWQKANVAELVVPVA